MKLRIPDWWPQGLLGELLALAVVLLAAAVLWLVARRLVVRWVYRLTEKTETRWDDVLVHSRLFERLASLVPLLIVYLALPRLLPASPQTEQWLQRLGLAALTLLVAAAIESLLSAGVELYDHYASAQTRPLKVWAQVLKVGLWGVAGIVAVATLMGREPWALLGGLGALSAVLMLVFKDSLLGLVASVQVSAYDMVRVGDWIEIPRRGIDGDVVDITLNTVKVRNFDKTIATVPTYVLISEELKNWRGMAESGGRRIKRAILLDISSIRFLDDELRQRLERIQVLREYLRGKDQELERWNAEHEVDPESPVNGRRMTNLGCFRAYVEAYLRRHPMIRQDMTFLVRQLPPGEHGLPLELYVFSREQRWVEYEAIMADIFDHLLAALPEFELRAFQVPSAGDLAALGEGLRQAVPGRAGGEARGR